MSELKPSEKLRVALALSQEGTITLERASVVSLIRAMEKHDAIDAGLQRRLDELRRNRRAMNWTVGVWAIFAAIAIAVVWAAE